MENMNKHTKTSYNYDDPYSSNKPQEHESSKMEDDEYEHDQLNAEEEKYESSSKHYHYHAVLNVSKEATEEDIKLAYRRLGLLYHPDKHQTLEDKAIASERFQSIQKAYDVLSDPTKRYLYENYGEAGLQHSWDVGPRLKTPEEIRAEYERKFLRAREVEMENLVKSTGELSITLNATQLLEPFRTKRKPPRPRMNSLVLIPNVPSHNPEHIWDYFIWPEVTQAVVKHSWQTNIQPGTTFNIQGIAAARNGIGTGNILGTLKHSLSSKLSAELTGGLGETPIAQLKILYNITSHNFVQVAATSTSISSPFPLLFVFGRRFSPNVTGYLTYRTGDYNIGNWGLYNQRREPAACCLGLVRKTIKSSLATDIQLSLSSIQASITASRALTKNIRARVVINASNNVGFTYGAGLEQTVTKHSRVGMSVDCTPIGGVKLTFRYIRIGQKFSLPIIISPHVDLWVSILAGSIPLGIGFLIDRLLAAPIKARARKEKLEKIRFDNAELLAKRKKEAEDAIQLMKKSIDLKIQAEECKMGLIIVEALYGALKPVNKSQMSLLLFGNNFSMDGRLSHAGGGTNGSLNGHQGTNESPATLAKGYIDVTIPVQSLVVNSQLRIGCGFSKSSLFGFYDPCLGEAKTLRILYKYQNKLHVVEVDDTSSVAAPVRAHMISDS